MRATVVIALALAIGAALAVGLLRSARGDAPEPVEAAIVMLIDYSGSVSDGELAWQVEGLIQVFADPLIEEHMTRSERQTYAVSVMLFAGDVLLVVPWTVLRPGDGSVREFRRALEGVWAIPRDDQPIGSSSTNQVGALLAAFIALESAPPADRYIVDLQTDDVHSMSVSHDNAGAMRTMRNEAWIRNVILNVIMIGAPGTIAYTSITSAMLEDKIREAAFFHESNTVSGTVWMAYDYPTYLKALMAKVLGEIS